LSLKYIIIEELLYLNLLGLLPKMLGGIMRKKLI